MTPSIGWLIKALQVLGFPEKGGISLPRVLAQSGVAVPVTGTTAETTLATIAIPAGAMRVNGSLRIRPIFSYTNSTNLKTLRIKLGGTSIWFGDNGSSASNFGSQPFVDVRNRGVANSQISVAASAAGVNYQIASAPLTTAIDMSVAQNLTITGTLASAGETIRLEGYTVEIMNP